MSKSEELKVLRAEIEEKVEHPWFFPQEGRVNGFLGTDPIFLVGERPATGKSLNSSGKFLYRLLEKYNAYNIHITDVIKSSGKVRDPYPSDISFHKSIFEREIEIISPTLMIALGQTVYNLLLFSFANSGIEIKRIWHFSYTRYGKDKEFRFENQLRESLKITDKKS
jgi:uracil-DNA glycosylase family 4